jgi:hypothetical protein
MRMELFILLSLMALLLIFYKIKEFNKDWEKDL